MVETDFGFGSPACADGPDGVFSAFGKYDHYDAVADRANCDESVFSIGNFFVEELKKFFAAREQRCGLAERQSMLGDIGSLLGRVPFEAREQTLSHWLS